MAVLGHSAEAKVERLREALTEVRGLAGREWADGGAELFGDISTIAEKALKVDALYEAEAERLR